MMKTMRWSTIRRSFVGFAAVGAMFVLAPASSLFAQDVSITTSEACRCVDTDGNEIENCTCFRSIGPEAILARVLPFGDSRARIGITVESGQNASDDARGARVTAVLDDGPADASGIQEDDIITRIDGKSLFDPLDDETEDHFDLDRSIPVQRLLAIARDLDPGDEVEIEYLRDGDSRTAMVEAEELDSWGRLSIVGPNWDADAMVERMQDLSTRFQVEGNRMRWQSGDSPRIRFETREGPGGWTMLHGEGDSLTIIREGGDSLMVLREGDGPTRLRLLREGQEGQNVFLEGLPEGNAFSFRVGENWALRECPGSDDDTGANLYFSFNSNCIGGLELMELKEGLADYFGAEGGVLVVDVHEDSATGLMAGDVILSIGDREATSPERAQRILSSYTEGEDVTFRILRRNSEMTVTGQLGS